MPHGVKGQGGVGVSAMAITQCFHCSCSGFALRQGQCLQRPGQARAGQEPGACCMPEGLHNLHAFALALTAADEADASALHSVYRA